MQYIPVSKIPFQNNPYTVHILANHMAATYNIRHVVMMLKLDIRKWYSHQCVHKYFRNDQYIQKQPIYQYFYSQAATWFRESVPKPLKYPVRGTEAFLLTKKKLFNVRERVKEPQISV